MSPLSKFAAGLLACIQELRLLAIAAVLVLGASRATAQERSAFPETPRPVRRIDSSPPISLSDTGNAPTGLADAGKTPIRRLTDAENPAGSKPRSQTTVWIVLIGIVAAAAGLSLWARRGGGTAHWKIPSNVFQVLGRTTVSGNQSVTLLRLGERVLLVSSSGPAMQTLAVVTDPVEVATITSECLSKRTAHVAHAAPGRGRPAARNAHDTSPRPVAGSIGSDPTAPTARRTVREFDNA